jgi:RNA processing factor Prp31
MIPTIKITCAAIIYYAIASVCNFDKITETTCELRDQVKEYVIDTCSTIVPEYAKAIFLFNTNVKDYLPLK